MNNKIINYIDGQFAYVGHFNYFIIICPMVENEILCTTIPGRT